MIIAKTFEFNSLLKAIIPYIKVLYRPHKKAVDFVYSLIKLPNLSKIQRTFKKKR